MIKGLQKDHHTLLDLILSHLHIINTNLLELFDSFIEAFDSDQNPKLLECIHIKTKLSNILIIEKYLKNVNLDEFPSVLSELKTDVLPIHQLVSTVLETITEDHHKRLEYCLEPSSLSKSLVRQSKEQDILGIFQSIKSSILKFETLLSKSQFQTKFNPSPYSYADIIIVDFDSYEEEYEELLDDLFEFKQILNDWSETIRKSSPTFIEYKDLHSGGLDIDDFGIFMDSLEMDSFEKFSIDRKEGLLIPHRTIF